MLMQINAEKRSALKFTKLRVSVINFSRKSYSKFGEVLIWGAWKKLRNPRMSFLNIVDILLKNIKQHD